MSFSTIGVRLAEAAEQDNRRSATRLPVEIDARVRAHGEEGCEVVLLNISETGFMAETQREFAVGSRVWLILPGRERANAIVKWTGRSLLGAEFAEPIKLAVID